MNNKLQRELAAHLIAVHRGGNWTDVNITDTLSGVDFQTAQQVTPLSPNSIAMILHHISFWNRVIVQRAQGTAPEIDARNGMLHPPLKAEADWRELKTDNLHSAEELAQAIEGYDTGNLYSPILPGHSSAFNNFCGQVEHVHYHLGQILMLQKYLAAQA
ncbi:DinB family protein [Niabella terrae]